MRSSGTGTLDEAYQRLHATGPEFDGWLSNHGPMAAEAMVRRGHADRVHRWLDGYMRRLEEFPRGSGPIGPGWREALGDPRRIADWTAYFRREVTEQPWPQALDTWWPRLLPGVAAAATHGVIRVGHAVRALTEDGEDADHLTELAHGLAYWAARWQPVPGTPPAKPFPVPVADQPAEAGLHLGDGAGRQHGEAGQVSHVHDVDTAGSALQQPDRGVERPAGGRRTVIADDKTQEPGGRRGSGHGVEISSCAVGAGLAALQAEIVASCASPPVTSAM
jgi:hypothetical protein